MKTIDENMELWRKAFVTDPSAVKKITGKPYQGDSPKPYWLIQRATEIFGACGEGWGVEVKSESFFRLAENEVMHSAVVVVWYMRDGKRCQIEQMGQTKACYTKKDGGLMTDEDAGKKSVTDGMVKCLSMIGFAGDIFSGLWNDSKYVEYAAAETEKRQNPQPEFITPEQLKTLRNLADELGINVQKFCEAGKVESLAAILSTQYEAAYKVMEKKRKATT